jgi:D-3-phosphoglycerate dehydrogenase
MKLHKIVCLDFTGDELEPSFWHEIDRYCNLRMILNNAELTSLPDNNGIDGLLVKLGATIDKTIIDQLPDLRYIGMLGTGCGGIDKAYAASRGITVTNIADYATEAVAEFSFAILLEHSRDIARARTQAARGDYSDAFSGSEIKGKRFGVVGLGAIGMRTAELAKSFGADTCYWSRRRKDHAERSGIAYHGLKEILQTCDIITISLEHNTETTGIISADLIQSIKPSAIVIITSPLELVDFEALRGRLKKQDIVWILDHSDELTAAQLNQLQVLGACIMYPAIGYLTDEASQRKKRIYIDNLRRFVRHTQTAGQPTLTT